MKKSFRWKIAQLLEIKWWKRYLADKDPDTYLIWKRDYWQQLLQELSPSLTIQPGMRVLDAGCGPAGVFIALDQCQVTALDPLIDAYQALPHFKPTRYPNVTFVHQTLESHRTDVLYDVIFCLNAINHVADIHQAYDVLSSQLKPGGYLVVSIDAHNHKILKHIFRAIPGDALHPHQYDLKEYTSFLEQRNCKVLQTLLKNQGRIFNYYVQVARKQ